VNNEGGYIPKRPFVYQPDSFPNVGLKHGDSRRLDSPSPAAGARSETTDETMIRILGRVVQRCENEQEGPAVMTTREAVAQLSGRLEDYNPVIATLLIRILRATC
jgi:hypothetical protein